AFRRDAAVVEDELGRLAAPEAHLLELLRNAESRRVCLDEERRDSVHTAGGIGLGVDERYVRNRPVSDEELSPVQNVLVSIAPRRRAHRAERVGARTRLGEREAADPRAVAEPWDPSQPLLRTAVSQHV